MANADEIRHKLRELLAANGLGGVAAARILGLSRTQISDFLRGKTQKLSAVAVTALSERFGIPARDLMPTPDAIIIHKNARPHLYVAEHMDARGYDDQAMADRMDGVSPEAVAKWRAAPDKLADWQVQAIVHAFGIEDWSELTRLPIRRRSPTKVPHKAAKGRKIA